MMEHVGHGPPPTVTPGLSICVKSGMPGRPGPDLRRRMTSLPEPCRAFHPRNRRSRVRLMSGFAPGMGTVPPSK